MNAKSTYHIIGQDNPSQKIAIIYAIDHIGEYLVEIKFHDTHYYLSNDDGPKRYKNLKDARKAAKNEDIKAVYLALSKTFEEVDHSTCNANHQMRYDYCELPLL